MSQHMGTAGVGDILSELISRKAWNNRLHLHQVFAFWDEVVGTDIALHAQPQVIRGTVLWVGVSDSMWMQQLQFERQYILEALNARLEEAVGDRQTGPGRQLSEVKLSLDHSLAQRRPVVPEKRIATPGVDQRALAEFGGLLESLADQELKESMLRLWLVMHRAGKSH